MIYQTIYDLLMTTIFAGATAVDWVSLVCTIVSTACTLFVVAVPFLVVYKVIQLIVGR